MKNLQKRGPLMSIMGIVLVLFIIGGIAYGAYNIGLGHGAGLADGSFDGDFSSHMRGFDGDFRGMRGFGGGFRGMHGFGMGFGGFFGFLFMFMFFGFLFRMVFGWGMHRRHHPGSWRGRPYWDRDEDDLEDASEDSEAEPKPKAKPNKKDK